VVTLDSIELQLGFSPDSRLAIASHGIMIAMILEDANRTIEIVEELGPKSGIGNQAGKIVAHEILLSFLAECGRKGIALLGEGIAFAVVTSDAGRCVAHDRVFQAIVAAGIAKKIGDAMAISIERFAG
jgi:hypothetical protein